MTNMLSQFDQVRIINIVDRTDRRREVVAQLERIGAAADPTVDFFAAHRPRDAGAFPSVGARGCFDSHLTILRQALADATERLLIIEDDFDFSPDIAQRGPPLMAALAAAPWDIFYGASVLDQHVVVEPADGLAELPGTVSVLTASFVAFRRPVLGQLVPFLAAMLDRPAGSPDYGPMHVDGAYSVFRQHFPQFRTFVCSPSIGDQRASRSDIATNRFLLDRFTVTRPLGNRLRRALDWVRG